MAKVIDDLSAVDRDRALAARVTRPGSRPAADHLDPDHAHWWVLVHCGPPAFLPSAPTVVPVTWTTVHCGPRAPEPFNPTGFARIGVASTELGPFPAPEITSRDDAPKPEKLAVKRLVKLGEACGWMVRVGYARGQFPHATTGRPGGVRDSLSVGMKRGGQRVVAVYVSGASWTWDTLTWWTEGGRKHTVSTMAELEAHISAVVS